MRNNRTCARTWLIIYLALVILACALPSAAQSGVAVGIYSGATTPSTCNTTGRNIFVNTTGPTLYLCTAANTWSALLSTSGGGSPTWTQSVAGDWNPITNNTYSIGNGLTQPKDIGLTRYLDLFAGASLTLKGEYNVNATGDLTYKVATVPPTALTATIAAGAGVDAGTHSYKVTFVTAGGETDAGAVSNTVTTAGGNLQVNLTAIPTGNQYVTSRKIYRTIAGNAAVGPWLLQSTIANNTATTLSDNTADAALTTAAPSTNTALDTRLAIYNNGITVASGSNFVLTGDFTDANASGLQNITGLAWTLPANTAAVYPFRCELLYSQATGATANAFGIKATGLNPTNIEAHGWVQTAAAVVAYGNLPTLATQTATNIVAFTPSAITTVWQAHLEGTIENPSGVANVINVMVLQGTAANLITIKRGSKCVVGN